MNKLNRLINKYFHVHEWEYLGRWAITYQQKRCKKCGKLKVVTM